ncbi:ComEC/Rec2 family competence protein, partial [candidate division WOR-3 bacterium]|nr:ComEC/Rec2 family competence protein [candidate division WOR-3 bacterium]
MKYASARALAAAAVGVAAARQWPWLLLPAAVLGVATLLLARPTRGWSLYVALACAAAVYSRARQPAPPATELFSAQSFTGTVVGEPQPGEQRRFTVELGPPGHCRVQVRLREPGLDLRYGDVVEVGRRVRPLDYPRNPGLTDYNRVLHERGVVGRASPKPGQVAVLRRGQGSAWMRLVVMPMRRHVARTIDRLLPGPEGGLLAGLLLGGRQRLPRDVQEAFVDAGIVHILAVSGMNVGIIMAAFWLLLSVLRVRGWWLFALSTGVAALYVALVGWSAAPARAGLMAVMAFLAGPTQRRFTPAAGLCAAGLVLLVIHPLTLFDVGAQLSFAATLAICLTAPKATELMSRTSLNRQLRQYLLLPLVVSFAAAVGTAPLLLHHFGRVQVLGFLASAAVALLVGLCIPVGLLAVVLNLAGPVLAGFAAETLKLGLSGLLTVSRFFGGMDWAIWQPGRLAWPWVLWLYALGLLAVAWRRSWARTALRTGLAGGLAIAVWAGALQRPQMQVTFLDPGSGDAVLIEDTLGRRVLIDAGIDGPGVVRDYLRSRGIRRIDVAVITHSDRDHYGGLLDVDGLCRVDELLVPTRRGDSIYVRLLRRLEAAGTTVHAVGAGTTVEGLGFGLWFVWPDPVTRALHAEGLASTNSMSLVSLAEYRDFRMLMTGDLDEPEAFAELGL